MNKILSLPEDLKQLKGVNYKKIKSCTFAKYTQTDTSHSTFVNVGSHLLTFVRKLYKRTKAKHFCFFIKSLDIFNAS